MRRRLPRPPSGRRVGGKGSGEEDRVLRGPTFVLGCTDREESPVVPQRVTLPSGPRPPRTDARGRRAGPGPPEAPATPPRHAPTPRDGRHVVMGGRRLDAVYASLAAKADEAAGAGPLHAAGGAGITKKTTHRRSVRRLPTLDPEGQARGLWSLSSLSLPHIDRRDVASKRWSPVASPVYSLPAAKG